MKKIATFLILLGLGALPALAESASFENVPVIDVSCSKKAAANPDAHTRSCALGCQKSGFGILTSDNRFLKFDPAGNKEMVKALEATQETDHLRVNVTGDVQGDTLVVSSIKLL